MGQSVIRCCRGGARLSRMIWPSYMRCQYRSSNDFVTERNRMETAPETASAEMPELGNWVADLSCSGMPTLEVHGAGYILSHQKWHMDRDSSRRCRAKRFFVQVGCIWRVNHEFVFACFDSGKCVFDTFKTLLRSCRGQFEARTVELHAFRERITRFVVVDRFFSILLLFAPSTRVIVFCYGKLFDLNVSLNVSLPFTCLHLSKFVRMSCRLRFLRHEQNSKFLRKSDSSRNLQHLCSRQNFFKDFE